MREFTFQVQRSKRSGQLDVTGDGKGLTGHSGTMVVGKFADRIGLTAESLTTARAVMSGVGCCTIRVRCCGPVTLAESADDFSSGRLYSAPYRGQAELASFPTGQPRISCACRPQSDARVPFLFGPRAASVTRAGPLMLSEGASELPA